MEQSKRDEISRLVLYWLNIETIVSRNRLRNKSYWNSSVVHIKKVTPNQQGVVTWMAEPDNRLTEMFVFNHSEE
jgi:hypothetical protein